MAQYICPAASLCNKEDCYHIKPHEGSQKEGCGTMKCPNLLLHLKEGAVAPEGMNFRCIAVKE